MSWLTSGRYLADDGTNPFQLPEADQKTVYPSTYDIVEYTNALHPPAAGGVPPVEVLGIRDRPPVDAVDGDKYIVSDTPFANGWHGMAKWIATKQSTTSLGWDFAPAGRPGTRVHIKDINQTVVWDGVTWQDSYSPPAIFVTDENPSPRVVGDIRFVTQPDLQAEIWNGSRWTRFTHNTFVQMTPPEAPTHDVHEGDLWLNSLTYQINFAHNGRWHGTQSVQPWQVGGTVWQQPDAGMPIGSIWWKQTPLGHYSPEIYNGTIWEPAYPPASTYTPPVRVTTLIDRQVIDVAGQVTPKVPLVQGQIGRFHVNLAGEVISRPKVVFYDANGKVAPLKSFVNDEILGSGTGTPENFHASSVRFGSCVSHIEGSQLRIENANVDNCRNDHYTNRLQLSYTLEYDFIRDQNGDDTVRMTLIGTAGTTTAAEKALPIRVHANFTCGADLTDIQILHDHNQFIPLMTHTLVAP
jgi:hypothetical protein